MSCSKELVECCPNRSGEEVEKWSYRDRSHARRAGDREPIKRPSGR